MSAKANETHYCPISPWDCTSSPVGFSTKFEMTTKHSFDIIIFSYIRAKSLKSDDAKLQGPPLLHNEASQLPSNQKGEMFDVKKE